VTNEKLFVNETLLIGVAGYLDGLYCAEVLILILLTGNPPVEDIEDCIQGVERISF
jgi:hypothetical protein